MQFTLKDLADKLKASFIGDADHVITGIASIDGCEPDKVTFAENAQYLEKLDPAKVGAIVVSEDPGIDELNVIIHNAPKYAMIQLANLFHPEERKFEGISPKAEISDSATIAEPTSINSFVVIREGARIGERTSIASGTFIGKDVIIGQDCIIHPNVTVEKGCIIGDRVSIHAGTVIGADGFGYMQRNGENIKIPQVGAVRIGNDVEIGANVCIDRGSIGDTVIGNGVKIDNLVQIAHNCIIGDYAVIVAQVGMSGSCTVGERAVLAGKVGLKDHVKIGASAIIAGQSVVTKDIPAGTVNAGYPAGDIETWRKFKVIQRNLPKYWPTLLKIIKSYEKK
jgi:UDP-3-O-[3-hydroxymyristoyl] glucosamine N-acyltransferase